MSDWPTEAKTPYDYLPDGPCVRIDLRIPEDTSDMLRDLAKDAYCRDQVMLVRLIVDAHRKRFGKNAVPGVV